MAKRDRLTVKSVQETQIVLENKMQLLQETMNHVVNQLKAKDFEQELASQTMIVQRRIYEALQAKFSKVEENDLSPEELTLCRQGLWIQAIKHVRDRTGLSLKEAKDLVDSHKVYDVLTNTWSLREKR